MATSLSHHGVVRVENGNVLVDLPGHADELRYDEAQDGKHGDAPVLDKKKKDEKTRVTCNVGARTSSSLKRVNDEEDGDAAVVGIRET